MKLAAFDIEIASQLPEFTSDWLSHKPVGISCAAVAKRPADPIHLWQGKPRMNLRECQKMVHQLVELTEEGYTLLTWNGCKFDFAVLANESGLLDECALLAMDHVDLMLMVTFIKGHYLSLDKALVGAGLKGKLKSVALLNGTRIYDMDGAKAPQLWAKGEYQAVIAYLREDVSQLLNLADFIERRGMIRWTSNRGRIQTMEIKKMLTVRECFDIPQPDVSWLRNPPKREDFIDWMPKGI